MKTTRKHLQSKSARRVFCSMLVSAACLASFSAMAGKPGSGSDPVASKIDMPLPYYSNWTLDIDTGDSCKIVGYEFCTHNELLFTLSEEKGIIVWGNPLYGDGDVQVSVLRHVRFDQASPSLVDSTFLKFTHGAITDIEFNDTIIADVNGLAYKIGFTQCHQYDANNSIDTPCLDTTGEDTEDDGGPYGDEGLRMTISPMF